MYYKNIASDELKVFHRKVRLTALYKELSSNLFITSTNKLVPKFYCDEITGNENVRIIDNQAVIYTDYNGLNSLYFSSSKENFTVDVHYDIVELDYQTFSQKYLRLHFYDATSFFGVKNFTFHLYNETMDIDEDCTADEYGNIVLVLDNPVGEFVITGNGQELSFEIMEEE